MENYTRLEQIGRGSFGTVHKIRRKSDGQIMVWKELDYGRMSDKEKQLVVSEVNILRELRHPYILRYHDRIIDKKSTKLYIIVEYCERGDLRHLIKRAKATRTFVHENRIWKYFAQILSALKTCHRRREKGALKPVLHRDIKPANVFLDRKDNVKLGDFGLARTLESMSKFAYTNVGTPFYMSPEQTNSKKYDERSDIWAVGCMMYELAALRPPFHASNQLALARKINDGRFDRIPKHYSENLYRAIRWMLHTEPTRRPRVEDLENLPEIRKEQKAWSSTEKQRTSIATSVTVEKNLKNTVDSTKEPTKSSSSTATDGLAMKEREAQLKKREVRVAEIEARLKVRESELNKREIRYKLKEEALKVREESISRREMRLTSTTSKNILLTPSVAPPAPSSIAERMMAAPKVTKAGSAEEALEAAKKRLERMAHKDNAPLGDVSNNNKYNRGKGEWSAQAQVDEILRKAKQRTQQYQNKPRV